LSMFRAAKATDMPSCALWRAKDALNPCPAPTINTELDISFSYKF
jgi:hypothetical protein